MVKGMDKFREYFAEYADQYVLIGGAACDISFNESNMDFRATKDLDMVLIVEAQTKEFAQRFWEFIKQGKYRNWAGGNGRAQFYRFDKPQEDGFPVMIELFSRAAWELKPESVLTPVHIDDMVSSLSAILLNDAYYDLLLKESSIINGISVLKPTGLLLFKAKAWIDLKQRAEQGEPIDSRNIKKHKNDILRISSMMVLETIAIPDTIKQDMTTFIEKFHVTDAELKNLGIRGVHKEEMIELWKKIFEL